MVANSDDLVMLTSLGALLREVARLHIRVQRDQALCGVSSLTACHVLIEVGHFGPMPMADIGRGLGLHKAWVSRVVGNLVEAGILGRSEDRADGRVVLIDLTKKGQQTLATLQQSLNQHAARVLGRIPPVRRAQVREALLLTRKALREELETTSGLSRNPEATDPDSRPRRPSKKGSHA